MRKNKRKSRSTSISRENLRPDSGTYILLIEVEMNTRIQIGKLGTFVFPKGFYTYTGSALRGLTSRITRHHRKKKQLHWHIDYFLTSPRVRIRHVFIQPGHKRSECKINLQLKKSSLAKVLIPGFGSSDCNSGCISHLLYWKKMP